MADLLAKVQTDWFRDSINEALHKEFESADVAVDPDFDFFEIINKAVLDKAHPRTPLYDDLFQEVVMSFLNRRKSQGIRKEWVRAAKRLQDKDKLENLYGLLYRSAKNLVRDLYRNLVYRAHHETHIQGPGDEDEDNGGYDVTRRRTKDEVTPEDAITAEELFQAIRKNLRDDRSRKILDIIVDRGLKGFLRGKGIAELSRELDTSAAMATYYRDKVFKPDLLRALRRLGDRNLMERAQEVFASHNKCATEKIFEELASIQEALQEHGDGLHAHL